jgi:hypothetical protein
MIIKQSLLVFMGFLTSSACYFAKIQYDQIRILELQLQQNSLEISRLKDGFLKNQEIRELELEKKVVTEIVSKQHLSNFIGFVSDNKVVICTGLLAGVCVLIFFLGFGGGDGALQSASNIMVESAGKQSQIGVQHVTHSSDSLLQAMEVISKDAFRHYTIVNDKLDVLTVDVGTLNTVLNKLAPNGMGTPTSAVSESTLNTIGAMGSNIANFTN